MRSKPKNDALFVLVRSLTDAEVAAFLNENEKSGDTIFYKLFQYIRNTDSFSEKEFRALWGINNSNFSVTKAYLTEVINKSLRNFHNGNDPEFHFPKEIHTIRVYLRKELHELAEKRLLLLKKYCLKYLLIEQLPEILSLEYHLAGIHRKDTTAIENERSLLSDQLSDFFALTQLNHKLFNLYVKSPSLSPAQLQSELAPLEKTFTAFQPERTKAHPRVRDVYLGCGVWYRFIKGDMQQAFRHQHEKALAAFENAYMRDFNVRGLLAIANNLASLAFEMGNEAEHTKAVGQMLEWHKSLKGYEQYKAEHRLYHHMIALQWRFRLSCTAEEVCRLEKQFEAIQPQMVPLRQLTIMIVLASTFVKLNQPEKALDWVNRFFSHTAYKSNPPLLAHIRLLQLLAMLMMQEWQTAVASADTLGKFLKKELGAAHAATLFVKKTRSVKADNAAKIYTNFMEELQSLPAEEIQKFSRHCIDLHAWCDTQLAAITPTR